MKKRSLAFLLALCMVMTLLPATALAAESGVRFAGGDGTEENPYQIATVEQLDAIRNDLDAYYLQTADIDLNGIEWIPIGSMGAASDAGSIEFSGSYDGNGFKISNLTISEFDSDNVCIGLFAVSNGIIKNINLENCSVNIDVSAGYVGFGGRHNTRVGSVAGYSSNIINNCTVSGKINVQNVLSAEIGGVVGYGNICEDSINSADISIDGTEYGSSSGIIQCGGITGAVGINSPVTNCTNYGNIIASSDNFLHCGGISGEYGAIESCTNYGNISGKVLNYKSYSTFGGNCNVGGIVGLTSSDKNNDCKNYGDVSSTKNDKNATCYSGGVIGYLGYYTSGTVSKCYNYGERISADENCAGRVVGIIWTNNVSELYSTSKALVNGNIPTEDIGIDKRNGANLEEAGTAKSVYFLSSWDTITRTVQFGDNTLSTPDAYTVANSVDVSNISSLLNKYVLVTMEEGDSSLKYTITGIQPVESKIGTVSEVYRGEGSLAVTSFVIDEVWYTVWNGNALPNLQWYKGKEILYHLSSDGTIMDFDVLEEKHGVLGSWNDTTKKITIGETEYPTNYLSDLSFMDNIRDYFQKDVTFLVVDSSDYCPMMEVTGLYFPGGNPEDFNVNIYHANWLSQDTASSTMLGQKTPSQILSDQVSSTMGPTATLWQSFTGLFDGLDDVSTFKDLAFEKKDMYTAIILTAIEASYSVDVLPNEYSEYEEYIGLSNSFVASVSNTMKAAYGYDITASGNLKKMTSEQQNTLQKVVDKWFKDNFPQLGDISEVLSGVKNGFKIMGDIEDLYEYVVSAIMLNTVSEDLKTVVRKAEELSKTSGNADLALALTDCVDIINSSAEQLEGKIAARTTISLGLDFLFDELQNQIQSVLCKSRPEAYILVKIYKVERDITDKFFKTDSIIEKYLKMMATLDVEDLVGRTYEELRKEFLDSKNTNTAKAYLRGMDIMYNMRKIDCSSANNYVDEIDGSLANKIFQVFGKGSYDELKVAIQNIQGSYKTAHVDASTNWINCLDDDYPGAGLDEKYEYLFDKIRDSILNREIKVACPVDVYVYDKQNNVVALVTDEQISCSVDDIAVAIIDSQKIIRIYDGADYRIEYVGNDDGDMDVTITEFDENAAPARTVNYYDIPLADEKTYYMLVDGETMRPYNLVDKTNDFTIQHDYDSMHAGTKHTVKVVSGMVLQNDEIAIQMEAGKGIRLQLNAYVPDGHTFVRWEVSNADTVIEDSHSQSTTMVMPNTDVTVTAVLSVFTDVPSNAWYCGAVEFVCEQKLMNGIGNNLFAPQSNLSRSQLAQILYNKESKPAVTGSSGFTDVPAGQWYTSAVTWANKQGIVGGYGNGLFGPNDDITREQLAVMLWRYAGKPAASGTTLNFTDADKVSSWALDAMRWATEKGIINGKGNGILDSGGKATRAEAAQMLKNFIEK